MRGPNPKNEPNEPSEPLMPSENTVELLKQQVVVER
jgi:hypothetical protein